jgi:hypothetical protein
MLVSCLAHSSILKVEVTCSSETSADYQWTTWPYISEDRTVHNPTIIQRLFEERMQRWIHEYNIFMLS